MGDYKSPKLSRSKLANLTTHSVDPEPLGRITRDGMNSNLTDSELAQRIKSRNDLYKPTYLLRLEYNRRLNQRRWGSFAGMRGNWEGKVNFK